MLGKNQPVFLQLLEIPDENRLMNVGDDERVVAIEAFAAEFNVTAK